MLFHKIAVVPLLLLLGGCASHYARYQSQEGVIINAVAQAKNTCNRLMAEQTINTLRESVQCEKDIVLAEADRIHYEDTDGLKFFYENVEALADDRDKNTITEKKYQELKKDALNTYIEVIQAHTNALYAEELQRQQTAAAIGASMSAGMNSVSNNYANAAAQNYQAIKPLAMTPQYTTCTKNGNSVQCFSQ